MPSQSFEHATVRVVAVALPSVLLLTPRNLIPILLSSIASKRNLNKLNLN